MGIKLVKGIAPEWFNPFADEAPEDGVDPSEFRIKSLTQPQLLECMEHFDYDTRAVKPPGLLKAYRYGVVGWRNIFSEDGSEAKFNPVNRDMIPAEVQAQVGQHILEISSMRGDEAKN